MVNECNARFFEGGRESGRTGNKERQSSANRAVKGVGRKGKLRRREERKRRDKGGE